MYKTFSEEKIDHLTQPMFFGKPVNVARYDQVKYPFIDQLSQRQLAFFWRPEEIDLSKDRLDYMERLNDNERHVFLSNLKYQTLLDSVQGRALVIALLKITSLPELENWIETWSFSETIHSRSYTHIIRNLVPNPSIIFDDIIENKYISSRASAITDRYDAFINGIDLMNVAKEYKEHDEEGWCERTTYALKKMLYLLLVDINALEALRFFVSFACSFSFAERALMEGNAKVIKLIARDELLHREGTVMILERLRNGSEGPEWAQIAEECKDIVPEIVKSVAEQEIQWAEYLFKDGAILGLNKEILSQYIKYLANSNLGMLGVEPIYNDVKKDPLPWMKHYLSSSDVQVAPQETEISSYLTADLDVEGGLSGLGGLEL